MTLLNMNSLKRLLLAMTMSLITLQAAAHHTETHFEDTTTYKVVYQLNKAEPEYIEHVLFSAGELLRKYGDDIQIIIVAFGPGIHLLGKHPERYIRPIHQQRMHSLASYGVEFQACGNTMKSLKWTEKDIVDEAKYVEIGADSLMKLQQQGFSYISW